MYVLILILLNFVKLIKLNIESFSKTTFFQIKLNSNCYLPIRSLQQFFPRRLDQIYKTDEVSSVDYGCSSFIVRSN